MANPEHVEIVKQGTQALNKWYKNHPNERLDLSGAYLFGINLHGAFLREAFLAGANLIKADLRQADLIGIDLRDAELIAARLEEADLSRAHLSGAKLVECNLFRVNLHGAYIYQADLFGADLREANLFEAELSGASLIEANLSMANLKEARLLDTDMREADIRGANLSKAILRNANLRGAFLGGTNFDEATISEMNILKTIVNAETSFKKIKNSEKCKIDRYTIASLGNNRGGLTDGNLITMDIHDDVAKLRSEFSGVWGVFHLIAIILFSIPYLWFLAEHRIEASFTKSQFENSVTLSTALARYIWNGGIDWRSGWHLEIISFSTFIGFLLYNVLRLSLLYKTKKLETQQEVSRLPAMFSFEESLWWKRIYYVTKIGVVIYFVLVFLNVYHFLQMRVAIET